MSNAVYKTAPYRSHGTTADTSNAADAIFRSGGDRGLLSLGKSGTGYVGSIAMTVHA